MKEIDAEFDHNAVFYEKDPFIDLLRKFDEAQHEARQIKRIHFVPFIPTAENLAKFWYDLIKDKLEEKGIKIKHVKVWETPTSTATYQE